MEESVNVRIERESLEQRMQNDGNEVDFARVQVNQVVRIELMNERYNRHNRHQQVIEVQGESGSSGMLSNVPSESANENNSS